MTSSRMAFARFAALALVGVVLSSGSFVVVERLGAPGPALVAAATIFILGMAAVGGAASGTMRLPVFLTQGRGLPAAGLSVATATAALFGLPGQPAIGITLGLFLAAFLMGPALRRSGAPTWPCFLGVRFSSPLLRALSAVVLAAASIGLGAAALAHAAVALAGALDLTQPQAAALAGLVLALTAVPGGARSQTRAGVALGLVVLAGAAALWFVRDATSPERMLTLLAPITRPDSVAVGVAAALCALCLPSAQTIWPGLDRPEDMRIGLLWAGVLTGAIAFGIGPAASQSGGLFADLAFHALVTAGSLAASGALLLAAGQAIGFDMRPGVDRRWTPASWRFAALRFATVGAIAAAGVGAALYPAKAASMADPAAALAVGALLPPLLLGAGWSRANAAGAITSLGAGLAAALALIDGRLGSPEMGGASAGLVACAVGLAAGATASLFTRRSAQTPRPLADDML
ncbi:hypothetical protein [Alsobacter soli]|nr:hypothetical protein [Alsobacter soli]